MLLNTDPVEVLAFVFTIGLLIGATLVQLLILPRVKSAETDNERLRKLIAPFDGDYDGEPGGSRKRA